MTMSAIAIVRHRRLVHRVYVTVNVVASFPENALQLDDVTSVTHRQTLSIKSLFTRKNLCVPRLWPHIATIDWN